MEDLRSVLPKFLTSLEERSGPTPAACDRLLELLALGEPECLNTISSEHYAHCERCQRVSDLASNIQKQLNNNSSSYWAQLSDGCTLPLADVMSKCRSHRFPVIGTCVLLLCTGIVFQADVLCYATEYHSCTESKLLPQEHLLSETMVGSQPSKFLSLHAELSQKTTLPAWASHMESVKKDYQIASVKLLPDTEPRHAVNGDVVVIEAIVGAKGDVKVIRLVRSLGPQLDLTAVRAAQGSHFYPAMRNRHPVEMRALVSVRFTKRLPSALDSQKQYSTVTGPIVYPPITEP